MNRLDVAMIILASVYFLIVGVRAVSTVDILYSGVIAGFVALVLGVLLLFRGIRALTG